MKVCAIMATCGRHHLAERSLRFFLDQDYENEHILLIYNNSDVPLDINITEDQPIKTSYPEFTHVSMKSKDVLLVNKKPETKYDNLGQIYNDALKFVPQGTDVIIHWDDDDIFLSDHITEGVKGLKRAILKDAKYEAYKPAKSYYRHPGGIQLMSNTLEPSIFVSARWVKSYAYSDTTTDQHLQWVNPLVYEQKISVEEDGKPTLIYNWGDTDIPTFKTSGNAGHPNNFKNYRDFSRDHGDQVLSPWPKENVQRYYNLT